jgi:pyridinium-3,5-biscarboxylic acid mononucleotide sulfurtransferase
VSHEQLTAVLDGLDEAAVAVSGGVDSLTLATLAARRLGPGRVSMVHATSPAVPPDATARVRDLARAEGWRLEVVDAGEFADPRYRVNPVNRCFFCKTNLYDAIAARTDRQVLSGANLDDLGEYRPGLDAAREHGVRHPYVEAGLAKSAVRALARELGLEEIAELPASPCLASRVETGLQIDPVELAAVHEVERRLAAELKPRTVRCRVRAGGVVVELDAAALHQLDAVRRADLGAWIATRFTGEAARKGVGFAPYRTGSAFLVAQA